MIKKLKFQLSKSKISTNKKGLALEKAVIAAVLLVILAFGFWLVYQSLTTTKPISKYQLDIQEKQCMTGLELKYKTSGKDVPSDISSDVDGDDVWDQCDRCVCKDSKSCANVNDGDEDGIPSGCDEADDDAKKLWNPQCVVKIKDLKKKGQPLRCDLTK